MNDVAKQDSLVKYIQNIDGVRKVNYSSAVADTLSDVNILIGYISVAVIVILLAVAVFLISNTVTIGISVRKEEIAIMKLIGATDYFVRSPFVIERSNNRTCGFFISINCCLLFVQKCSIICIRKIYDTFIRFCTGKSYIFISCAGITYNRIRCRSFRKYFYYS